MLSFIKSIMTLAVLGAGLVQGSPLETRDLDKSVVNTPLDPTDFLFSHTMYYELETVLGSIKSTNMSIKICYDCQNKCEEFGYNSDTDMTLFNVTYADCRGSEWVMCRHNDALISSEVMAAYTARVPLNMRKYLRHIMVFPSATNPDEFTTFDGTVEIDEGNLILVGNVTFQTFLAAVARVAADYGGFPTTDNEHYWESKAWLDAYAKDTALVNNVAKESQEENFKQMVVVAVYDAQVPGSLGNLTSDWTKFENMLQQIQKDAPSGTLKETEETTCDGKVSNERPGSMDE